MSSYRSGSCQNCGHTPKRGSGLHIKEFNILMLNIFKTKFSSHLLNDCGNRVLKEGYIFKLISLSLANGPHHFSFFH